MWPSLWAHTWPPLPRGAQGGPPPHSRQARLSAPCVTTHVGRTGRGCRGVAAGTRLKHSHLRMWGGHPERDGRDGRRPPRGGGKGAGAPRWGVGEERAPREAATALSPKTPHERLAEGTAGDRPMASCCVLRHRGPRMPVRPVAGGPCPRGHQSLCGARDQPFRPPLPRETSRRRAGRRTAAPWGSGPPSLGVHCHQPLLPSRPRRLRERSYRTVASALSATFENKRKKSTGRGPTLPALAAAGSSQASRPHGHQPQNPAQGSQAEPSPRRRPPQQGALATRP